MGQQKILKQIPLAPWYLAGVQKGYKNRSIMSNIFNLIPQPVSVLAGSGSFMMTDSTPLNAGDGCQKAADFAVKTFHLAAEGEAPSLNLNLVDGSTPAEGYKLSVTPEAITVEASDEAGLFHAIQTLRQLLPAEHAAQRTADCEIPAVTIEDAPAFSWRAMHLDVCRHFFDVEFVKKYIDLLAFHKMNIFHWHLTEDQGWRMPIDAYPKLAEVSAWRESTPLPENRHEQDGKPYGGIYTKDEIREVVAYADSLGITVMPEIELPGHTIAVLAAYPELGCTGENYKVRTEWGIEDDVFCAGNDQVFEFLETVFDEVLELFPSEYIHIGGDECPKVRWQECDTCQTRIKEEGLKNEDELQSWFVSKIGHYLAGKGRKMIGWDEILEGGLPDGAAVASWRGTEGGIEAASQGHKVVMTPTTHCYFDYYQIEDRDSEPPAFFWPIPEEHRKPGMPAFWGLVTLERTYSYDPLDGVPKDFQNMIMGGQANLWTEYVPTNEQAEYQTYPRGSAIAETLWSPMPDNGRDFDAFISRLAYHLKRLDSLGVNYRVPKEHLEQS